MSDRRSRYEDDPSNTDDALGDDPSDQPPTESWSDGHPDSRRRFGERELGEHALGDELQVVSLLRTIAETIRAGDSESCVMSRSTSRALDVLAADPPTANVMKWPERIGKYLVIGKPLGEGGQGLVFRVGSSGARNVPHPQAVLAPDRGGFDGTRRPGSRGPDAELLRSPQPDPRGRSRFS